MDRKTCVLMAALLAGALSLGCVVEARPAPGAAVCVRVAPPPPRVEVAPAAPSNGHVWVKGHYRWDGAAYLWCPGGWVVRPHARAVWVDGRWRHGRGGWYWVPGHWR